MKIRPLHDQVVIRCMEEKTTTAGGIVLPGSAAEKPTQGEIVAVGNGKFTDNDIRALDVKVGDKLIFQKNAGTEIKIDGENFLVIREEDIVAVIN